jgi:hypothetical protein
MAALFIFRALWLNQFALPSAGPVLLSTTRPKRSRGRKAKQQRRPAAIVPAAGAAAPTTGDPKLMRLAEILAPSLSPELGE